MSEDTVSFTELSASLKNIDTNGELDEHSKRAIDSAISKIHALAAKESSKKDRSALGNVILLSLEEALAKEGIKSGKVAELGGPFNSFANKMPNFEFTFLSLYPVEGDKRVKVADITCCDYIPSNTFDVVFSKGVLEHVDKPWLAGKHISRILKPGGIAFHAAPFSYFYHGAPADFWRYTPDAFEVIMSELEPVNSWFIGDSRRRDNRGSETNPVDGDGGTQFAVDSFGGWRENWSTVFVGRKNPEFLEKKIQKAEKQVILDAIKGQTFFGVEEEEAIIKTHAVLSRINVDHDGMIEFVDRIGGLQLTLEDVQTIWKRRGKDGVKPSYARFKTPKILNLI